MSFIVAALGGLVEHPDIEAAYNAARIFSAKTGKPFTIFRVQVVGGISPNPVPDSTNPPAGTPEAEAIEAKAVAA